MTPDRYENYIYVLTYSKYSLEYFFSLFLVKTYIKVVKDVLQPFNVSVQFRECFRGIFRVFLQCTFHIADNNSNLTICK